MSSHTFQSRVHTWPSVFVGTAMWQVGTSRELAGVTHLEHEGMRKMIVRGQEEWYATSNPLTPVLQEIKTKITSFGWDEEETRLG